MRFKIRSVVCLSLSFLVFQSSSFADVPNRFTFQGSAKQNGVPLNGTYPIEIRLTNSDGTNVYWAGGAQQTPVKDGLYRVDVSPGALDWSAMDAYVETRVNGTVLLPREKLTSVPYSAITKELTAGATAQGDVRINGQTIVKNGSVSSPGLIFQADSKTGLYTTSPGQFQIAINGAEAYAVSNIQFSAGNNQRRLGSPSAYWTELYSNKAILGGGNASDPSLRLGNGGVGLFGNGPYEVGIAMSEGNWFSFTPVQFTAAGKRLGSPSAMWTSVWAENGVIQTSSSLLKRDIRDIQIKNDINVPRGIMFKWKKDKNPATAEADYIGFNGDDLPEEAHALLEDGTRDPEHFYTSAVIGLLCAKVRSQADEIKDLSQRLAALERRR